VKCRAPRARANMWHIRLVGTAWLTGGVVTMPREKWKWVTGGGHTSPGKESTIVDLSRLGDSRRRSTRAQHSNSRSCELRGVLKLGPS
jgi:hypothetical protein